MIAKWPGPLRHDVESMSRLVNQLLEISELETFVVAEDEIADIVAIAAEVAAFLAPLALSQRKTVAVTGARRPVRVRGNSDALVRAVQKPRRKRARPHFPRERPSRSP